MDFVRELLSYYTRFISKPMNCTFFCQDNLENVNIFKKNIFKLIYSDTVVVSFCRCLRLLEFFVKCINFFMF